MCGRIGSWLTLKFIIKISDLNFQMNAPVRWCCRYRLHASASVPGRRIRTRVPSYVCLLDIAAEGIVKVGHFFNWNYLYDSSSVCFLPKWQSVPEIIHLFGHFGCFPGNWMLPESTRKGIANWGKYHECFYVMHTKGANNFQEFNSKFPASSTTLQMQMKQPTSLLQFCKKIVNIQHLFTLKIVLKNLNILVFIGKLSLDFTIEFDEHALAN